MEKKLFRKMYLKQSINISNEILLAKGELTHLTMYKIIMAK